ncbi:MAG: hypothetical protein LBH91_01565 [Prevotellaceae bacterium]|nr:hypothetical protein [Prevotellaceae bacterium]
MLKSLYAELTSMKSFSIKIDVIDAVAVILPAAPNRLAVLAWRSFWAAV